MNLDVVAGTDGSEASMRAAEWAAHEAALRGASLRVLSVPALPSLLAWNMMPLEKPEDRADKIIRAARQSAAKAAARAAGAEPGLQVIPEVRSGVPGQVLSDLAASAAMVVVGSRGHGGFAALVLGSVSRYVAFEAPYPVVVTCGESAVPHHEIVVGLSGRAQSEALSFAFEEAELRRARLHAVHAWPALLPEPAGAARRERDCGGTSSRVARWLAELLGPWRQKYPGVEVTVDIVHAVPGHVLVSMSARAGLIVLGRSGGESANRRRTAPVAHSVLSHAECPVAIIPEGPFRP